MIGLGNTGREYEQSRHNLGFLCIDELARRHHVRVTDHAAKSLTARVRLDTREMVLAKPQTMMNLSGLAAKGPAREVRRLIGPRPRHPRRAGPSLRPASNQDGGSSAGNHGLDSLIASFGTREFIRLRVGVGRPVGNGVDYVLGGFTPPEREQLPPVIARVADAVTCLIDEGLERAMTDFNKG